MATNSGPIRIFRHQEKVKNPFATSVLGAASFVTSMTMFMEAHTKAEQICKGMQTNPNQKINEDVAELETAVSDAKREKNNAIETIVGKKDKGTEMPSLEMCGLMVNISRTTAGCILSLRAELEKIEGTLTEILDALRRWNTTTATGHDRGLIQTLQNKLLLSEGFEKNFMEQVGLLLTEIGKKLNVMDNKRPDSPSLDRKN